VRSVIRWQSRLTARCGEPHGSPDLEEFAMSFRHYALFVAAIFCVLAPTGCSDPVESICDRAAECGGLAERTREQCIADFKADLAEGQLEDCANCVEEHSCSEIADGSACNSACDF
jgi:hypothetical protein